MNKKKQRYYVPGPSQWPMIGSVGLFFVFFGLAHWLHQRYIGPLFFGMGVVMVLYMLIGWFSTVIHEDQAGLSHNKLVDRSFRLGMVWFIFTEVMFFGAFFGALFYIRFVTVPWLGEHWGTTTHILLWPNFEGHWPLLQNPDPTQYEGPESLIETWQLPALNTLILLSSAVTVTLAQWGLLHNLRQLMVRGLWATILLGVIFLCLQGYEFYEAYVHMGLTLDSGIYGTTFFMLTGFHGLHVTLGIIMLAVILGRCVYGHFTAKHHFAFEAVAWYWHFVDVVWLFLFLFVYWL